VSPPGATASDPSEAGGWHRLARLVGPSDERWGSILLLAVTVGVLSGASAVGLRAAVHRVFHALDGMREGALGPLLPAVGAVLGVAIVTRLFRERPGHGVPDVIRAVCRDGGRMRRRSVLSRWLGSWVNVSSGGSAGLEGPIVFTGAAIGSLLGGSSDLDERRRTVLLGCGVAGGIAAVFNAPIAGMIFAIEVVLAEWSAFSVVPIVMSAVAATEVSRLILGDMQALGQATFSMGLPDLFACAALGALAGLLSVALVRSTRVVEERSKRFRHDLLAPAACGVLVGLIGIAEPGAIGEGYDVARSAIRSELAPGLLLCASLALAKLVTTSLTIGSGAPGGLFAPCLVFGSVAGVAFGRLLAFVAPAGLPIASEGSYALAAMAGLLAGVMHAPLTGIFLAMEVTGGYEAVVPLMIVSVLALVVVRRFEHDSPYTRELAESGDLLRPGTDSRILADVRVRETLDRDSTPIPPDMTLADFTEIVKESRRNHFPVVDPRSGRYLGMLELAAVRRLVLDPALSRVTLVGTVMDVASEPLHPDATLAEAMERFDSSGAWVLPVTEEGRFVGLLSKSTLFDRYRRELVAQVGA